MPKKVEAEAPKQAGKNKLHDESKLIAKTKSKQSSQKSKASPKRQEDNFQVKPKKPLSAWLIFNTETVQKLKQKHDVDHKEAFAQSAALWQKMTDKDKKPFEDKSKKDEARY